MKNIKGVIFDMDGVILDTESLSLIFWEKIFKKHNIEIKRDAQILLMGKGKDDTIKGLKEIYGKELPMEEYYKEKGQAVIDYLEENKPGVKKGFESLLKYLLEHNYKTAIATSTVRWKMKNRMKFLHFDDMVGAVICGDEVKETKPNPEIFLKAAEKLNLSPKECLVIEDSKAGVEAAYNGGFKCIMVPDFKKPDEELREKAYKIMDSLEDVEYLLKNSIE
ncbi:HAD family hydrolase [Peptacetobacter sp.]|uniref:HAD family hydrolase n=1 Tax=Peptacetobacter sp. TaxID=2991975 RepID=UPI0026354BCD|nr:HAD family phosphatase [Peptacetobacter sp.]